MPSPASPLLPSHGSPADQPFAPGPCYDLRDLGETATGEAVLPLSIHEHDHVLLQLAPHPLASDFTRARPLPFPATCRSESGRLCAGATGNLVPEQRAWASHLGAFGERLWPGSISFARGINDGGQVVGDTLIESGPFLLRRAFIVGPNGRGRFLNPPCGGTTSAMAINNAGSILLNAVALGASGDDTTAWLWHEDQYIRLPDLGGGRSWGSHLTPEGRVVGHSTTADGRVHGFLADAGEFLDFGDRPGCQCHALSANDHGITVGRIVTREGVRRAFRWTVQRGLQFLDTLTSTTPDWSLHEAVSINARGAIAIVGTCQGRPRGAVLAPA